MRIITTFLVLFLIGSMGLSIPAFADDTDGTIFYTLFVEGEPSNVKSLDYDYVSGTNTLTVMNIVAIGHTDDADGIVVNPQNPDLLIIGTAFNSTPLNSADDNLATVVIAGGAVATFSSPVPTFHLELTDATTIYAAGLPGELVRFTINGDGSLSSGTQITFTAGSDDIDITQLITITDGPNAGKFFYTSSVPAGSGNFGELTFGLGDTATTTRIHSSLPAAHGGEYDPFSDTVIIVGSNHITQINPSDGSIIHDLVVTPPSGFIHFDQGIVDANGHIIIADNGGFLFLVDYPSGALSDGTTQVTSAFVEKFLDDIAPLIMPPDEGDEGCTPGYWKANAKFKKDPANAWTLEDPDDTLDDAGFSPQFQSVSTELLDALKLQGGKDAAGMERNLLRHCVAAKLNAENPNVAYAILNSDDVILACNEAMATEDRDTMEELKDQLDEFNNAGCSINMKGEPDG